MLDEIEIYLSSILTEERTAIFINALKLIHSYEVTSPIESINEVVFLEDTYSKEESIGLIESIIVNVLQEILAAHYILSTGDINNKLTLLQCLNLLEHFIDSDVIVTEYDDDITTSEMLLKFLTIVSNKPIEYFDEFIIDVRPQLINNLVSNHQDQVDANLRNEENGIESSKYEIVKAFAEKHPESLGIKLVTSGLVNLNMDLTMLINLTRGDIYKLSSPKQIAEAVYSVVLISNTEHIEIPKKSMEVVNNLFDDLMLIGELKYLVTSFD